jgi:hypothetical protein
MEARSELGRCGAQTGRWRWPARVRRRRVSEIEREKEGKRAWRLCGVNAKLGNNLQWRRHDEFVEPRARVATLGFRR